MPGDWSLQASFDGSVGGFERIELTVDAGDAVPLPDRAIARHRVEAVVRHAIIRLRDESIPWKPLSHTTKDLIVRGVGANQVEHGHWRRMSFLLFGAPPVPAWYKGRRALAVAAFLERLAFDKTEIYGD